MLQVLFRIPMMVAGLPLWVVLLVLGVGIGFGFILLARRLAPSSLAESLGPIGRAVIVAGLAASAAAYYFRDDVPKGVPIYGFGMMLFLAFLVCTWVAGKRGEREGIANETMQDLAIWIFGGGLLGARISYLMMGEDRPQTIGDFLSRLPRIWDGGIILYGSVVGGILSYFLAYWLLFRRRGVQTRRFADAIAPCIAIGICLGRLGCFLNGCCYGGVTCADCTPHVIAAHFPMPAPPRDALVRTGRHTSAGFTLVARLSATVLRVDPDSPADKAGIPSGATITSVNGLPVANGEGIVQAFEVVKPDAKGEIEVKLTYPSRTEPKEESVTLRVPVLPAASRLGSAGLGLSRHLTTIVEQVDPTSAAYRAGLRPEAMIVAVNDTPVQSGAVLDRILGHLDGWERGETIVNLSYHPPGGDKAETISFRPTSGPLYPTQIYEVISMALLCLVLFAYEGFRRNPGQVAAVLMVGYGIHRFLNEILRDDDRPIGFERYGSLLLVVGGVILWVWLQRFKAIDPPIEPVGEAAKKLGITPPPTEAIQAAPGP